MQKGSVDINILDGSNRDQDVFFRDDELISSIKKDRSEETQWRRIESRPQVRDVLFNTLSNRSLTSSR